MRFFLPEKGNKEELGKFMFRQLVGWPLFIAAVAILFLVIILVATR